MAISYKSLAALFLVAACVVTPSSGRGDNPPHPRAPLTDAVRRATLANNQFSFDMFGQLSSSRPAGENLLISPFSISTALAMTYAGARGQTADQMAHVFHWAGTPVDQTHQGYGQWLTDLNAPRHSGVLTAANRLFGQQGYGFHQSYLDLLAGVYNAPLEQLDFVNEPDPSRIHINDWVAGKTNNLIRDLLPDGSVTSDTRLVLTNAVYFNGHWKHEFKENLTTNQPFHLVDGSTKSTSMMFQNEKFGYGQFDGFKMLELPYEGDDLSMVIVLPNECDGLAALEASLTAEVFSASVDNLWQREVNVHLPKFKFRDKASLRDSLSDLGMPIAFSGGADFSGMADDNLAISDVLHKTFIDVNETGTEAAAATGVIVGVTSLPPPPVDFRADHPFLFALRDRHTGGILFWGRMADPVAANADAAVPEPTALALGLGAVCLVLARRYRAGAGFSSSYASPRMRR